MPTDPTLPDPDVTVEACDLCLLTACEAEGFKGGGATDDEELLAFCRKQGHRPRVIRRGPPLPTPPRPLDPPDAPW